MSSKLTRREQETLEFINDFLTDNGFSPTRQEIMNGINTVSAYNVQSILERLEDKGYITAREHTCRSIVLIHEVPKKQESSDKLQLSSMYGTFGKGGFSSAKIERFV